jgi:hypothetical protein
MVGRWVWGAVAIVSVLALVAPLASQTPALLLRVGAAEQGSPAVVQLGPLLNDPSLKGALDSALPLRFHLRVELWRRGFIDRLAGSDDIDVALLDDPLGEGYTLETATDHRQIATLLAAQQNLAAVLQTDLRPSEPGRYYYLATLEVETLSLSDIDELRRWLRGEVGPAIEGQSNPMRAVERGLRRVLIRVIGLPARRFEARTGFFDVG